MIKRIVCFLAVILFCLTYNPGFCQPRQVPLQRLIPIPKVVAVETEKESLQYKTPFHLMRHLTWKLKAINHYKMPDEEEYRSISFGTAFFLKGKIVSVFHVVEPKKYRLFPDVGIKVSIEHIDTEIWLEHVNLPDKKIPIKASKVKKDIAIFDVLKKSDRDLLKDYYELSEQLEIGMPVLGCRVYLMSYAQSFPLSLQDGIISNEDASSWNDVQDEFPLGKDEFLIYSILNHGSSGGPVFEIEDGKIIILGIARASTFYAERSPAYYGIIIRVCDYEEYFEEEEKTAMPQMQ